jgi:phosphoribosylformylglycinamidine synthase subunit PurS
MPRVVIDVMLKDEILDPQGQAVERALPSLGFTGVGGVRIGKHIEVQLDAVGAGDLDDRVEAMVTKLLANPVLERFSWRVGD